MQSVGQMLDTNPNRAPTENHVLAECIEACAECALTCTACADACDGETEHLAMLRRCVRNNLDCAVICATTATVLSRQLAAEVSVIHAQVEACAIICTTCGDECERHANKHEHCRVCGDACRRCVSKCRRLLRSLMAS